MQLDLSPEDIALLGTTLDRVLVEMERELVRTDAPAMQHALNTDFERLRALRRRLGTAPRTAVAPLAERPRTG
jgi:hypothetical protein